MYQNKNEQNERDGERRIFSSFHLLADLAPLITSLRGPRHRHEAPARPLRPGPHLDRQLPRPEIVRKRQVDISVRFSDKYVTIQ